MASPPTPPRGSSGESAKEPEHVAIIGEVYPRDHAVGTLPPLIPVPDPDSLQQWDSDLFLHGNMGIRLNGTLERRHSGWEAVEQQWGRRRRAGSTASSAGGVEGEERQQGAVAAPPPHKKAKT